MQKWNNLRFVQQVGSQIGALGGRPTDAEAARAQALAKQLSQLDATSSKIGETLRFLSDYNNDGLNGPQTPQQVQQLQQIEEKLREGLTEIERLQGRSGDSSAAPIMLADGARQKSRSLPRSTPSDDTVSPATPPLVSAGPGSGSLQLRSNGEVAAATAAVPQAASAAGDTRGTVTDTVVRLTHQAAEESAAALSKVKEEQRKLQAVKKELTDLERDNEEMRSQLATRDVRRLREASAQLQAQLREARAAEEELQGLQAEVARLPQLQAEADALKPVAAQVEVMEAQLQGLRDLDQQRLELGKAIALLQPKVMLVDKMRFKVEQLEAEVARGEQIQERLATLQAEAEKLPALRSRMYSVQAGAAEARHLERLMQDYGRQEEWLGRLQAEEEELQSRVSGIERLKKEVDALRLAASEADQLEVRFASLASTAARLPALRAQVQQLQQRCGDVAELEEEVQRLKNAEHDYKVKKRQSEEQRTQTEAHRTQQEQEELEAAWQQQQQQASSRRSTVDGALSGSSVHAIVQSMTSGPGAGDRGSAHAPLPGLLAPPAVSLVLNIVEPDLLPGSVAAQLARQRAEVAALRAAEEEMRDLDGLEKRLKQQVEAQRASPAARQVVRLQVELLEMQGREVEQLSAGVDGLAGVSGRLAALKAQHAKLEKEADEVFVLQSQLPEMEAAAARAVALRRRRDALQTEVAEVRELEATISEMEAALGRRHVLEAQVQELRGHMEELDRLAAELAQRPAVQAKLARAQQEWEVMQSQARLADEMEADTLSLRQHLAEAVAGERGPGMAAAQAGRAMGGEGLSGPGAEGEEAALAAHLMGVRAKHAALVEQNMELQRLTAESELLLKDNEMLKMQLNVGIAMYGASAVVECVPPKDDAGLSSVPEEEQAAAESSEGGETNGSGRSIARTTSQQLKMHGSLDAVFKHMRGLESDNAGLHAMNEELMVEVDQLRAALDMSLGRLDAFKGLAQSVSLIRGKKGSSEA